MSWDKKFYAQDLPALEIKYSLGIGDNTEISLDEMDDAGNHYLNQTNDYSDSEAEEMDSSGESSDEEDPLVTSAFHVTGGTPIFRLTQENKADNSAVTQTESDDECSEDPLL